MRTPVVVIGAGQAGLAMSHQLTATAIDHVVLERGEVAQSWRTERWDSLRLLTPNWMSRLPGHTYRGDDPDGFMASAEVVELLSAYRRVCCARGLTQTTEERVRVRATGFDVETDQGAWQTDVVVVASGACSEPHVPAIAAELPPDIEQVTALQYRNPDQLGVGEVLVVGASASGAQIAEELARSGRRVTLAVGAHVRVPRIYRGLDIHWWMDAIGQLDERSEELDDINRARRVPSLQLVGSPERRTLDLNALTAADVRVVGKLMRVVGSTAQFTGAVANLVATADLKQNRLLDRIDEYARQHGLDGIGEPNRPEPTRLGDVPTELSLSPFTTVVWATGYRPTYPWLDAAAFDRRKRVVHDGGVGAIPGLYFLGLPFMRRRKSSFIDGVGPDATELVEHLRSRLGRRCA
jgi:putative flavoprotein involved in K+ transport